MKLIMVTGLSGAGKSTALDSLEDMGYYCIDNMPPALIGDFVNLLQNNKLDVDKAAICIDVRTELYKGFKEQLDKLNGIEYEILYLEASDEVLIRRYGETRRKHPLSETSVTEGIAIEKEFLAKTRKIADTIVDTSNMNSAKLKAEIKDIVSSEEKQDTFVINVSSFGYKHGIPMEAELVFDMRFVPNPYYIPELKPLDGTTEEVSNFVLGQEITQEFLGHLVPLIEKLVPAYEQEGKYRLNVALGCTGGHHRSVATAVELARILKEMGYRITLRHRDL